MLKLRSINKVYKTKYADVEALKDVNLEFDAKGLVFVVGESGSGKSTLLNLLGTLDSPTSGEIEFDGVKLTKLKQHELDSFRNYNVGFVFQDYNLIEEYNVFENINLGLELQGDKNTKQKIADILAKVGLKDFERRKIKELSGGQKQRVAIAKALVKDTSYILGDEPTGNLDTNTSESIFKTLKEIAKDKLLIIVTHDRDKAFKYGDRVIELLEGKVVSDKRLEHSETQLKNESIITDNSTDSDFQVTMYKSPIREIKAKKQKNSYKQIFKFATRNMWHRKIRLVSTILLCSVCLSVFGLSISYINNDVYKNYLSEVNDYDGYASVSNAKENSYITDENFAKATQLFGDKMLPIYATDKANVAVITPEIAENFSFILGNSIPNRDSWLPRNSSEVVALRPYSSPLESTYKVCGVRAFQEVAEVTLDTKQTRKEMEKYAERIIEKGTNRYNYKTDEEYKESIITELNSIIYSLDYHKINYFVHPDFVTEILPHRPGMNKISFDYEENIFQDNVMRTLKRTAKGNFNHFGTLKKYATKIYYKRDHHFTKSLKKDEVVISDIQLKIYLTTILNKPYSEITDYEIIEAFNDGNVPNITLKYGEDSAMKVNIIGFYQCKSQYEDNSKWFSWSDDNWNIFDKDGTSIDIVPFIVSDELYDNNGINFIINSPKELFINFGNIDVTTDMLKYIYENLDGYELDILGLGSDLTGFVSISKHNNTFLKQIWMYIALGMAGLSVISILGYIWAVIHDSRSKIGILRAQGMNNYSIVLIYLIETLVICSISIVLACLGAWGLSISPSLQGFSSYGELLTMKSTTFGILQILSICGFGLGIGILGCIIPIVLISRKAPVLLIREKNS